MELIVSKSIAALMLPPGGNFLLALVGLLLLSRWRRTGVAVIMVSVLSLYGFSMPLVANSLSKSLEQVSPYPLRASGAENMRAIVVLGGGRNHFAPEYGGETISSKNLERLRYAARLHRKTGLPILVTGGQPFGETIDEAALMKGVLVEDFNVPVEWVESKSRNTEENARFSASILKSHGVHRAFLVSHASHLRRAVEAFERAGLGVIPAPTGYQKSAAGGDGIMAWAPSAKALKQAAAVLREYMGVVWYQWRFE
jgi:uncharacterized SAM-binding protein YcdF (DUF218 family)